MKKIGKNTIMISLGFLGGFSSWPLLEFVLFKQGSFPNYLIFFMTATVIPGLFMGFFMGSTEGLMSKSFGRTFKGALLGLCFGSLGGIVGGLIGQLLLVNTVQYFPNSNKLLILFVRTMGWSFVGLFVGISEGVRAKSFRKVKFGAIGGILGGAIGGFLLEIFAQYRSGSLIRLIGLVAMGSMICLFYTFIDKKYSFGILRVLNGKQAGKRYRINQKKMDLGSGNRTMIFSEYDEMNDKEIELKVDKGIITVIDDKLENNLFVNEKATTKTQLKYGDVIKAGSVKLLLEAE